MTRMYFTLSILVLLYCFRFEGDAEDWTGLFPLPVLVLFQIEGDVVDWTGLFPVPVLVLFQI